MGIVERGKRKGDKGGEALSLILDCSRPWGRGNSKGPMHSLCRVSSGGLSRKRERKGGGISFLFVSLRVGDA